MKIRAHVGSLRQAMKTQEYIEPTMAAVAEFFSRHSPECTEFKVQPYARWVDARIDWTETWIVLGLWPDKIWAPVGWTDQEIKDERSAG